MASKQRRGNGVYDNKWRARRKRQGVDYFLGVYPTKEAAEEVEREFDKEWPARQ